MEGFAALLLLGAAQAAAQPSAIPPAPARISLVGGPDFISPMGEPFRSKDALSGAEHWFEQADADHDGRITREEMRDDAARFYRTLDVDRDGELGPDEINRYETEIAPEIAVTSTYGDLSLAKTDSDGKVVDPPYPTRLGAGRYGYLDMPEPVIATDANMDRAVSLQEFETASARRLRLLDADGDGAITRAELPHLAAVKTDADGAPGKRRRR